MGFSFLFGSHARTVGCGRHHWAVVLSSPTKAEASISHLAYNINNAGSNAFLSARCLGTAPLFALIWYTLDVDPP